MPGDWGLTARRFNARAYTCRYMHVLYKYGRPPLCMDVALVLAHADEGGDGDLHVYMLACMMESAG